LNPRFLIRQGFLAIDTQTLILNPFD